MLARASSGSGGSSVPTSITVTKTLSVINGVKTLTISELSKITSILFYYGSLSGSNEFGYGALNGNSLVKGYNYGFANGVESISDNTFTFRYNNATSMNFVISGY